MVQIQVQDMMEDSGSFQCTTSNSASGFWWSFCNHAKFTYTGGSGNATLVNVANGAMQIGSGDVIYIENRPVARASDQTEDIKLIIEFYRRNSWQM